VWKLWDIPQNPMDDHDFLDIRKPFGAKGHTQIILLVTRSHYIPSISPTWLAIHPIVVARIAIFRHSLLGFHWKRPGNRRSFLDGAVRHGKSVRSSQDRRCQSHEVHEKGAAESKKNGGFPMIQRDSSGKKGWRLIANHSRDVINIL